VLVAETLQRAGYQAYAVGGCVRDLLLARPVNDLDLATNAHPEQVESVFSAAGLRTVAVGRQFGVVVVVTGSGANVEVATFRHDGAYIDGRRPVSVTFSSAEDDVRRRDFTVNALLHDLSAGLVIDHVGGLDDLAARRIRAVGDAAARFQEDRLRILRALRFAAHLGFAIETSTWEALCSIPLAGLSAERVMQEWFKGLAGERLREWYRLLVASGQMAAFCPPLAMLADEARAELEIRLERARADGDKALGAAIWLSSAAVDQADAWLLQQPLPAQLVKSIRWLLIHGRDPDALRALPLAARRRLWRHADATRLGLLLRWWHGATPIVAELERELAAEAAGGPWRGLVRAEDLMALGCPAGPVLGVLLKRLEDAQLEGRFTQREDGLALARQWIADAAKPSQS
jgi:tRNA nucleotidyltransferase/poly(A) polymerase